MDTLAVIGMGIGIFTVGISFLNWYNPFKNGMIVVIGVLLIVGSFIMRMD